ncbi:Bax inhibitor-1/YccA family protein [Streptomyces sp. NPDC060184]|uniref:Bax inhibitor-1/YccA family membrane protein n=1 Tax=Streptomyces sp. NPDC060184 TaxID=3347064 RepID=UPI003664B000
MPVRPTGRRGTGVIPVEQRALKSSNPILSRPQFERSGGQKTAVKDPRAEIPVARSRSGTVRGADRAPGGGSAPVPVLVGDLLTMDGVLSRAAAALGVAALAAGLTWTLPPLTTLGDAASYSVTGAAALIAATLVVVQRRRNLPSMAMTLAFAAFQGVFLGMLSATASRPLSPGVFVQTVLATMAACGGALLAHGLRWMRAHRRARGCVGGGLLGTGLLAFADWLLFPLTGADTLGLAPFGLGVFMGVVGLAFGTSFAFLHLRQVEKGITHGTARAHAWTAAFGLTLTLTWLYVETARLLTLYQGDDYC